MRCDADASLLKMMLGTGAKVDLANEPILVTLTWAGIGGVGWRLTIGGVH